MKTKQEIGHKYLEDLLTRAKQSDSELEEITDFLAGLNMEQIELTLHQKFQNITFFIWDIKNYLEKELEDKQK